MSNHNDHSGTVALTICEALPLAINDHNILPEKEVVGVLRDSGASHENAVGSDSEIETHRAVAALTKRIITDGNSVRHP